MPTRYRGDDPNLLTEDEYQAIKPTVGKELKKGIARGTDLLQANLFGGIAAYADSAGATNIRDAAEAGQQRNMAEAAQNPAAVSSTADIGQAYRDQGIGAAVDKTALWAAGGLGELAPQVGSSVAANVVGRRLGGGIGGAALTAGQNIAQETGSIYGDILEKTGQRESGTAMGYGAAAGAIDTVTDMIPMGKMLGEGLGAGNVVGDLAKAGAKQALIEAPTEAAQTAIERAAVTSIDPDQQVFNAEGRQEIVDAAALGALGGGVAGAGAEGIGRAGRAFLGGQDKTPPTTPMADIPPQDPVQRHVSQQVQAAASLDPTAGPLSEAASMGAQTGAVARAAAEQIATDPAVAAKVAQEISIEDQQRMAASLNGYMPGAVQQPAQPQGIGAPARQGQRIAGLLPAPVFEAGPDGTVRSTEDMNAEAQARLQAQADRADRIRRGEILDRTPVPQAPAIEQPSPAESAQPAAESVRPVLQPRQPVEPVEMPSIAAPGTNEQMQNRERSRHASIKQMKKIANNPDFDRLGEAKDPEHGAPMVYMKGDAYDTLPAVGRDDVVTFEDDGKTPIKYAVVEADSLQASHDTDGRANAEYSKDLPAGVLRALNNGRTAGIKQAYSQGSADKYREALRAAADRYGIDPIAIDGMDKPVLVRLYREKDNTKYIGARSNAGGGLRLSPSEQARTDALMLEHLDDMVLGDNGEFVTAKNRSLVSRFMKQLPSTEVGALVNSDGEPTGDLVRRLRNAILSKAYGDNDLVEAATESEDLKNLMNALNIAAPRMASLPDDEASGLRRNVVLAAQLYRKAKNEETTVKSVLDQGSLFGDGPEPETAALAEFMEAHIRSPKQLGEALRIMGDYVEVAYNSRNDIFGDKLQETAKAYFEYANNKLKEKYGEKAKLVNTAAIPEGKNTGRAQGPHGNGAQLGNEGSQSGRNQAESQRQEEQVAPAKQAPAQAHEAEPEAESGQAQQGKVNQLQSWSDKQLQDRLSYLRGAQMVSGQTNEIESERAAVREEIARRANKPLLSSYTNEEIAQRESAAEQARIAEAEQKDKVDRERDMFSLQQPQGQAGRPPAQGGLFSASGNANPESNPAKTEDKPAASKNTIFTEEAAEKAREILRRKLGGSQLNSGVDPEVLQAGMALAGYHIEKGARTFAAYSKAMIDDMGDFIKPYLKSWYMGVKYDPKAAGFDGMSSAAEVEAASVDQSPGNAEDTPIAASALPDSSEAGQQQGNDRDSFSIERYDQETGSLKTDRFERGDYVKGFISANKSSFGEIEGISHAKKEAKIGGVWFGFGSIYKAERPQEPGSIKVPLSDVIEAANKKYGADLTDDDRVNPASKTPTVDAHRDLIRRMSEGTVTPEEFKASFEQVIDRADEIKKELSSMTKAELLKEGGYRLSRYANDKKYDVVRGAYHEMVSRYAIGGSLVYGMGKGAFEAAVRRQVEAVDADALAAYAKEVQQQMEEAKARVEARAAGMDNPVTLDDFNNLLRSKMAGGMTYKEARLSLTPEQRARADELSAETTRERREARKRAAKTEVKTAGQTVGGEIVATKHTKKGHDLWVVKLAERVSKEDYTTLNNSAKRLGGYYSSFRGAGAIPGFQFTDKANAEAFLQLAAGDTAAAQEQVQQRRDVFEDDRSQTAVERLTAMADRLEERADEALTADRKTNTSRRAAMAASAEAKASASKALAITMRNIAEAISAGKAKFLDAVREKAQVELLESIVRIAKGDEIRAKYPNYGDQLKHQGEKPTAETADYADFPSFVMYRSDLATLGRKLADVEGTKKLGQKLLSVADDVTDAYLEFAKENLHKVQSFSKQDGTQAIFPTKAMAEAAIRHSGHTGKAIVLPYKRGQNIIILSPSEAIGRGVWAGDGDKRITLRKDFGIELVESIGRRATKANSLSVPWQFENAAIRLKALSRMGIETPAEFRSALREFIALREQAAAPDKIKEMERAMIGRRNDGLDFFPTPEATADEMIKTAEIQPGMRVLEPSAGMGHIAERIRAAGVEPDVIEMSGDRRELLEAKGFNLVANDFTGFTDGNQEFRGFTYGDVFRAPDGRLGVMRGSGGMGSERVGFYPLDKDGKPSSMEWVNFGDLVGVERRGSGSGYDRIIMNPPFSDRRDAEHVRHAYSLLKPGGRIVAIMGEGVFFGRDKKAKDFRDWLESVGGTDEKLDEGTFLDPSLPVNTGVNARMVVIDKPESAAQTQPLAAPASSNISAEQRKSLDELLANINDMQARMDKAAAASVGDGQYQHASRAKATTREANAAKNAELLDSYKKSLRSEVRSLLAQGYSVPEKYIDLIKSKVDYNEEGKYDPIAKPVTEGPKMSRSGSELAFGTGRANVRSVVNSVKAGWKNAPEIIVADSVAELPFDAPSDAAGAFWKGRVYMVSSNIRSRDHAEFVLLHEVLGHYGLAGVLGNRIKPALRALYHENKLVRDSADKFLRANDGATIELAVEEALSDMAGAQVLKLSGIQRLIAAIRNGLRAIGFKLALNNNDVMMLLHSAKAFVQKGGKRPAAAGATMFSRSDVSQSGFYSELSRAAAQLQQQKGTTDQMLAMLKKAGAKPAEIEATGLEDYLKLQGGSVTKQQIREYLDGNGVQVQETMLGESVEASLPDGWTVRFEAEEGEYVVRDEDGEIMGSADNRADAIRSAQDPDEINEFGAPKFGQYVLPGGKNYRELLLTLPAKKKTRNLVVINDGPIGRGWILGVKDADTGEILVKPSASPYSPEDFLDKYYRAHRAGLDGDTANFRSSHYDQPNILAHVRFNERTDAEGRRVLFIEEIQSDWAQKGRKDGFDIDPIKSGAINLAPATEYEISRGWAKPGDWKLSETSGGGSLEFFPTEKEAREASRRFAAELDSRPTSHQRGSLVPSAPFVTKTDAWVSLALKRMITYAAQNGFDRVAWTTGEQQAARYDLSNQVDSLLYKKNDDGTYHVSAQIRGSGQMLGESLSESQLEDQVGKEIAKKIVNGEGKRIEVQGKYDPASMTSGKDYMNELYGVDLKVGGEGMKSFYDNIVPKVAKEVLKKVGGDGVKTVGIPSASAFDKFEAIENGEVVFTFDTRASAKRWADDGEGRSIRPAGETLKQPGFDITTAMREQVATKGLPLFSRSTVMTKDQIRQEVSDFFGGKLTDAKPAILATVPLNYMKDFARDGMTAVPEYIEIKRKMDKSRDSLVNRYDERAQDWFKWHIRNKEASQKLMDLMHDSTIAGQDPSVDFVPTGDQQKDVAAKAEWGRLRARYLALPEKGQQLFVRVRDDYAEQRRLMDKTIEENIKKAAVFAEARARREYRQAVDRIEDEPYTDEKRDAELQKAADVRDKKIAAAQAGAFSRVQILRKLFESAQVDAPYFPLFRDGDYFAAVYNPGGGVREVRHFKTASEQTAFVREQKAAGFKVKFGRKSNRQDVAGAVDPRFVADVDQALIDLPDADAIRDQIYQRYLESLPDMSIRKSFIHRKKTPGYSNDALKAYGSRMFHGAYQIARARYSLDLQDALERIEEQAKNAADPSNAQALANEMNKRHEWVMNPNNSAWSQWANTAAFVYALGLSPVQYLLNASQTVMMGIPILGSDKSRGGFVEAARQIARASKDFIAGKGDARNVLKGEELKAMQEFYDLGLIDRTQTYDLAGIGENGSGYSAARTVAMAKIGWFFQKAEVYNREATALAAYRMARAAGVPHEIAIKEASEKTWESHFDYTSGNRARIMQGDWPRVFLVFRQYSINMLYRLFRDIRDSIAGESPAVKNQAQRQLGAMMGMYALFAGATGVPFYGLMMMVGEAFDDEDEDFEQEFKAGVVEFLGPTWGRIVLKGVPGTLLNVDLSSRIGMGNLWFRDIDAQLEGKDAYWAFVQQVLGAVPSMGANIAGGIKTALEGNPWRGIEAASPAFMRSLMRSGRYFMEGGADTMGGDRMADTGYWDAIAQGLGFTPAHIAERYETNAAIRNIEDRLRDRRRMLLNEYAAAVKTGDGKEDALKEIQAFNKEYPAIAITLKSIHASLKARARRDAQTEDGLFTDRKMRDIRDRMEIGQ